MLSPEHRAVLLLLGLGVAGHLIRVVVSDARRPPGEVRLAGSASSSAALARRDSLVRLARPVARGERIDVDRASAQELQRLPGVGPGLARRIVEERNRGGPFGDTAALRRVEGIGPSKLRRMAPNLAFSAPPRSAATATPVARSTGGRRRGAGGAGHHRGDQPGLGGRPRANLGDRPAGGRRESSPFATARGRSVRAADLARVLGISLALAQALWAAAGAAMTAISAPGFDKLTNSTTIT